MDENKKGRQDDFLRNQGECSITLRKSTKAKGNGGGNLPFQVMGAAIWGWLLHHSVEGMVAGFWMKRGRGDKTIFSDVSDQLYSGNENG